jgi:hypothetical protein
MADKQGPHVLFCMPNATRGHRSFGITEARFLFMAAKQGPNVLFCMPNATKCILLISVVWWVIDQCS